MALPTFFIIGAAKAGTTSLSYYLDLHPEISMSEIKETHFFSGDPGGQAYLLGRVSDLADYEALFDANAPARGEACPSYAAHPFRQGVPERIHDLIPGARIIYMVRDPVQRTVSHYQHRVADGGERRSLGEVLGEIDNPANLRETTMSLYAAQLDRYLEFFPVERILVIDQADLQSQRNDTLGEIFDFVGVDPSFRSSKFNEELLRTNARVTYPVAYNRFARKTAAPLLRRIPPPMRKAFREKVESRLFRSVPPAELEDAQLARLREIYAPDVARLRSLTGKQYPTWSL